MGRWRRGLSRRGTAAVPRARRGRVRIRELPAPLPSPPLPGSGSGGRPDTWNVPPDQGAAKGGGAGRVGTTPLPPSPFTSPPPLSHCVGRPAARHRFLLLMARGPRRQRGRQQGRGRGRGRGHQGPPPPHSSGTGSGTTASRCCDGGTARPPACSPPPTSGGGGPAPPASLPPSRGGALGSCAFGTSSSAEVTQGAPAARRPGGSRSHRMTMRRTSPSMPMGCRLGQRDRPGTRHAPVQGVPGASGRADLTPRRCYPGCWTGGQASPPPRPSPPTSKRERGGVNSQRLHLSIPPHGRALGRSAVHG